MTVNQAHFLASSVAEDERTATTQPATRSIEVNPVYVSQPTRSIAVNPVYVNEPGRWDSGGGAASAKFRSECDEERRIDNLIDAITSVSKTDLKQLLKRLNRNRVADIEPFKRGLDLLRGLEFGGATVIPLRKPGPPAA
jgi:hypothetical protein